MVGDSPSQPVPAPSLPLWRRLLPFVIAGGLVAFVVYRLDFEAFVANLAAIYYPGFIGFVILFIVALLLTDSFATVHVYRKVVGPVRFREFVTIRAASYLPAMVNHHLGQAWITYYASTVYRAPLWRTAGATLLVYATTFACLFVFATIGYIADPSQFTWMLPVLVTVAVLGLGYLVVLRVSPASLANRQLTAPLFEVGIRGHLLAMAARFPHIAVLFMGTWIPFRFFGVDIPFSDALILCPPLMVVVALPVTPQGLGTRDAYAALVLAAYATGTSAEQLATVAATTLSWAVGISLVQIPLSLTLLRPARALLDSVGRRMDEV